MEKHINLALMHITSLFKSGRKDIMPNDIKEALRSNPLKGTGNSLIHVNSITGTKVYVNPNTNLITGIQPKKFKN